MSRGSGGLIGAPADAMAAATAADATAGLHCSFSGQCSSAAAQPSSCSLGRANAQSPKADRQAGRQTSRQAGRQATDYGTAMNDGCGGNRKQLRTEDATMCESEHDFFRKPF